MNIRTMTVSPFMETHVPAIIELVLAQEARQATMTPRAKHTRSSIEATLTRPHQPDEIPLVVLNPQGSVRGYAQSGLWEIKANSPLRAFLSERNGTVQMLTLPDPIEKDAFEVADVLLAALDNAWQQANTTGNLIRWPSGDIWLADVAYKHGFQLDSICAFHPLEPGFAPRQPSPLTLQIRTAQPPDEVVLVKLLDEELTHHENYTPFVDSNPQVLEAFRRRLQRSWTPIADPYVLVGEQDGEIIALLESTLLDIGLEDEPGITPPGRYWCIDNISVHAAFQGQGIGHLLLQALEAHLQRRPDTLDGYLLWYNPANPQAARFWSRHDFQPVWTTYQKRRS